MANQQILYIDWLTKSTACVFETTHSGMAAFSDTKRGDDLASLHLRLPLLELHNCLLQ